MAPKITNAEIHAIPSRYARKCKPNESARHAATRHDDAANDDDVPDDAADAYANGSSWTVARCWFHDAPAATFANDSIAAATATNVAISAANVIDGREDIAATKSIDVDADKAASATLAISARHLARS